MNAVWGAELGLSNQGKRTEEDPVLLAQELKAITDADRFEPNQPGLRHTPTCADDISGSPAAGQQLHARPPNAWQVCDKAALTPLLQPCCFKCEPAVA